MNLRDARIEKEEDTATFANVPPTRRDRRPALLTMYLDAVATANAR